MRIVALLISVLLIIFDQISKYAASVFLEPIGSFVIIDGFFELFFLENTGAAFGILQNGRLMFLILTPIVLCAIVYYFLKLPVKKTYNALRVALILIFSGATGNFLDRVRQGYVVDFFYAKFIDFPVFNIADIYLVTGTALFAILFIFFMKDEKDVEISRAASGND